MKNLGLDVTPIQLTNLASLFEKQAFERHQSDMENSFSSISD